MDFTSAMLLNLSVVCIHLILVDTMNSTIQDDLREKQQGMNEPDIFSIISKANNELLKRTGSKVIEYGDILVSTTRNAMICQTEPRSCLWPSSEDGNVYIPYVIDNKFSKGDKQLIWKSLHEINSLTCVKFYYRQNNEPGYISVKAESGCYSGVGYGKNERKLSLKIPECVHFGVIAHEFLHAIGFQHEQCRSDRDKHIKIIWDNIVSGLKYNFNLLDTNNLGTIYDYGSIMQYGSTAFTKNGKPTMIPKPDPNVELGQIRGLSTKDVLKVNRLYNCDVCGNTLIAPSGNISSPNFPDLYPNNADCKWLIRARSKFKILLTFSELQIQEFAACIGDHLTIYDGSSIHADILEGPTCGAETPAVISTQNELFVSFISTRILPATGFTANYKFITCGHMLMTKTGIIKSKPDRTKNAHCFWVLLVKRFYKITLKFEELRLQNPSNCLENSLIIYDAGRPPIAIAGHYCNEVPLPLEVTSTARTVVIEFLHKKSPTKQGFKVSYERLVNENPPLFSGSSHEGSYCNKFVVVPFISLIFSQRTIFL